MLEPLPRLGCRAEWQRSEVGLIRPVAVKTRMGTPAVIEIEISADRAARLADAVVDPQVYLLVFDAPPEPFNSSTNTLSGYAPLPSMRFAMASVGEHAGKRPVQGMRAPIRGEDLRLAVTSQGSNAEGCFHRDR